MTGHIISLLLLLFGLYTAIAVFLIKALKRKCEENQALTEVNNKLQVEVEMQQENLVQLFRHTVEIAEIINNRKETDQDICGAKSNEEILDIINTVLKSNNDRVHDDNG